MPSGATIGLLAAFAASLAAAAFADVLSREIDSLSRHRDATVLVGLPMQDIRFAAPAAKTAPAAMARRPLFRPRGETALHGPAAGIGEAAGPRRE
jgi:hypothetical protein